MERAVRCDAPFSGHSYARSMFDHWFDRARCEGRSLRARPGSGPGSSSGRAHVHARPWRGRGAVAGLPSDRDCHCASSWEGRSRITSWMSFTVHPAIISAYAHGHQASNPARAARSSCPRGRRQQERERHAPQSLLPARLPRARRAARGAHTEGAWRPGRARAARATSMPATGEI